MTSRRSTGWSTSTAPCTCTRCRCDWVAIFYMNIRRMPHLGLNLRSSSLLARKGVARVVGDQCQYGQQTETGDPLKKPTGWMSNSPELPRLLGQRCNGRHSFCSRAAGGRHALCNSKIAHRAAIYHHELCQAILRAMKAHMILDGTFRHGEAGQVQQLMGCCCRS